MPGCQRSTGSPTAHGISAKIITPRMLVVITTRPFGPLRSGAGPRLDVRGGLTAERPSALTLAPGALTRRGPLYLTPRMMNVGYGSGGTRHSPVSSTGLPGRRCVPATPLITHPRLISYRGCTTLSSAGQCRPVRFRAPSGAAVGRHRRSRRPTTTGASDRVHRSHSVDPRDRPRDGHQHGQFGPECDPLRESFDVADRNPHRQT